MKITEISVQNFIFFVVVNFVDFLFFVISTDRIRIDMVRAITPPSFDGMDRRIT